MKMRFNKQTLYKGQGKRFSDDELQEMLSQHNAGASWPDIADGTREAGEICRKAVYAYTHRKKFNKHDERIDRNEFHSVEEHHENGEIDFNKKVFFDKDVEKTPDMILKELGYDPNEWAIASWRISEWDVQSNNGGKTAYAVRGRIRPKSLTDMRDVDYFNAAKEFFSTHKIAETTEAKPKPTLSAYKDTFLVEVPAIELHLGKRSHVTDAPENYDIKDAERCFNRIIDCVISYSKSVQTTGNCLLVIGNDFFNAEFNNQTTNGTPQQNDGRYKKLFIKGMELYTNAIERMIPVFNHIDVRLCQGNHAQSAEFYLYHSLSQYFRNVKNVNFSDNYRTTQAYVFGDVGIFFTHGDENEKRTIASIPAEFPEEWGKTKFRELHLGHLHKEGATITEMGGMITRRIPSPCAADDWHYNKRFIGNQRCHQFFIWHRTQGLVAANYVNV